MARYRPVFTGLWVCDDKFQDYSAPAKLLFLFLITNDHLGEAGIYKITYKTMSNETALTVDRIKKLIHGELKNNVSYDAKRNVIFVHKFLKFNGAGNPELIKKSINKDRRLIKTNLWGEFDSFYTKDLKPIENHFEKVSSNSNTNSNTNSNSKQKEENLEAEFEEFWSAYREMGSEKQKKNYIGNKEEARKEYKTLRKKQTKEIIVKAIHGYADFLKYQRVVEHFEPKKKYVTTFLRSERWKEHIDFKYEPPM